MNFTISDENLVTIKQRKENGILYLDIKYSSDKKEVPESFFISFKIPSSGCYSLWSPSLRFERFLGPDWDKRKSESRLALYMPVHSVISMDGQNRLTVASSDVATPITIATGVCEEDATIECKVDFFTIPVAPLKEYNVTLRIDIMDIPYYESIYNVSDWWENDCGYKNAFIPEQAKMPVNSLWYSYHQNLDTEDIVKECVLSKEIGMETVIVDDGWETDDNNRGYAFCGDWEVAHKKIPDIKKFVKDIHDTGMKAMLWFSVPFVGINSKNFERFKDMLLDESGNNKTYFSLDPRYKEVRDFLIDKYKKAVAEWGFDGLKLDFIDAFILKGKSLLYDERRDMDSLEEAIDKLIGDTYKALIQINPDVLIEFRQAYVGPMIRKYANMLRAADCPNDAIKNRSDIISLRLTSGKTPVHSDMIMWNYDDDAEKAAIQFASILYSVPQISMKIQKLNDEHKKMLKFYLAFWKENKDVLLDGKVIAYNPESDYSLVYSQKDNKAIFTAYTDRIIPCKDFKEIIAVNVTRFKSLVLKEAKGKEYRVLNCMGEVISEGIIDNDLIEIAVPLSGMIFIK